MRSRNQKHRLLSAVIAAAMTLSGAAAGMTAMTVSAAADVTADKDLYDAEVTVDTEAQTVTVTLDGETVPESAYRVLFFSRVAIRGGESLTNLGGEFPTEPGAYIATVIAVEDSGYVNATRSAVFTLGGASYVSFIELTDDDFTGEETASEFYTKIYNSTLTEEEVHSWTTAPDGLVYLIYYEDNENIYFCTFNDGVCSDNWDSSFTPAYLKESMSYGNRFFYAYGGTGFDKIGGTSEDEIVGTFELVDIDETEIPLYDTTSGVNAARWAQEFLSEPDAESVLIYDRAADEYYYLIVDINGDITDSGAADENELLAFLGSKDVYVYRETVGPAYPTEGYPTEFGTKLFTSDVLADIQDESDLFEIAGFMEVDEFAAEEWADAPQTGTVYLAYYMEPYNATAVLRCLKFVDGVYDNSELSVILSDIENLRRIAEENTIYYTTAVPLTATPVKLTEEDLEGVSTAEELIEKLDMDLSFSSLTAMTWTGAPADESVYLIYGYDAEKSQFLSISYKNGIRVIGFSYKPNINGLRMFVEDGQSFYYIRNEEQPAAELSGTPVKITEEDLAGVDTVDTLIEKIGIDVSVGSDAARAWNNAPANEKAFLIYGRDDNTFLTVYYENGSLDSGFGFDPTILGLGVYMEDGYTFYYIPTGNVPADDNTPEAPEAPAVPYRPYTPASDTGSSTAVPAETGYTLRKEIAENVSDDDLALIASVMKEGEKIARIYKVEAYKGSTAATEPGYKLHVELQIPEELIVPDRTFTIIRLHNGRADRLETTYSAVNQTANAESDRFSLYAIVYFDANADIPDEGSISGDDDEIVDEIPDDAGETDAQIVEETDGNDKEPTEISVIDKPTDTEEANPHTGAPLASTAALAALSFFGAIAACTCRKKK